MDDEDEGSRRAAAAACMAAGWSQERASAVVREWLQSGWCSPALYALREAGPDAASLADAVRPLLGPNSEACCFEAAEALTAMLGEEAAPVVMPAIVRLLREALPTAVEDKKIKYSSARLLLLPFLGHPAAKHALPVLREYVDADVNEQLKRKMRRSITAIEKHE